MSGVQATKSDLFRDWINAKFDEGYDYGTSSKRKLDLENFIDAHPELKTTFKTERALHGRMLVEILKKKEIDPRTLGFKKKTVKFRNTGTLKSNISSKPQGGGQQTAQPTNEIKVGSNQKNETTSELVVKKLSNFDAEAVEASINAFYLMLKSAFPHLEMLSDKEKASLGKLWLPAFNLYLTEKWEIIGIPLLATLGMVAPKLARARKLKKLEKSKEKTEKKSESKEKSEKDEPESRDAITSSKKGDELWDE